jgi:hypothetical protein
LDEIAIITFVAFQIHLDVIGPHKDPIFFLINLTIANKDLISDNITTCPFADESIFAREFTLHKNL